MQDNTTIKLNETDEEEVVIKPATDDKLKDEKVILKSNDAPNEEDTVEKIKDEDVEIVKEDSIEDKNKSDEETVMETINQVYSNFKEILNSDDFEEKLDSISKDKKVPKDKLKSGFIKNLGKSISKVLNLGLDFIGTTVKALFGFLDSVVKNIVDFGSSVIRKFIALITFTPIAN